MIVRYEVLDDPDDLPVIFKTYTKAQAYTYKRGGGIIVEYRLPPGAIYETSQIIATL
jgi:hypothetical protein